MGKEGVASGRWLQRVDPTLHGELMEAAKREGVSLNLFVATALARALGQKEGFAYGRWAGTMLERASRRSPGYSLKSPQEQWAEDKALGLLDWDGETEE